MCPGDHHPVVCQNDSVIVQKLALTVRCLPYNHPRCCGHSSSNTTGAGGKCCGCLFGCPFGLAHRQHHDGGTRSGICCLSFAASTGKAVSGGAGAPGRREADGGAAGHRAHAGAPAVWELLAAHGCSQCSLVVPYWDVHHEHSCQGILPSLQSLYMAFVFDVVGGAHIRAQGGPSKAGPAAAGQVARPALRRVHFRVAPGRTQDRWPAGHHRVPGVPTTHCLCIPSLPHD